MTKQANGLVDVDDLAARVAHELVAKEAAAPDKVDKVDVPPVPVPQAAWETLERLQLAAQVSHQQLQVFVDGLALGQGVAQGAQLAQMPQGGWAWVVRE